jgi:hypothetical protein
MIVLSRVPGAIRRKCLVEGTRDDDEHTDAVNSSSLIAQYSVQFNRNRNRNLVDFQIHSSIY